MDSANLVGLSTAIIAGLVALTGYLLNQFANRRERKSKVYAEALEALREYQELPYKIRRRPDSNGTTRAALGDKTGDVVSRLWFYRAWLQTDSAEVGAAYRDLMTQTKQNGGLYRASAWSEPVLTKDEDAPLKDKYIYDNKPELALYLLAIRRELSPFAFLLRRSTRRLLARQRERRNGSAPSDE
jgi:hypothetical protein